MKIMVIVLAIAVLGLIGGGAWWLMGNKDMGEQTTNSSENSQQSTNGDEVEPASIITYSDTGFRVSEDTIPVGSTVRIVNESNRTLQFSSDPHPQHQDNTELNMPALKAGEQTSFVVHKAGKWGFHNHLNEEDTGSITVTD